MFVNLGRDMGGKISTRVAFPDLKNISVEIIDNVNKWEGLKPQWDSLVAQSLCPNAAVLGRSMNGAGLTRLEIILRKGA
jgi:hypothetical protein